MHIICFGDSNTFGFDPRSYLDCRYAPEHRWVDILAAQTLWNVRNNGMNGREIPSGEITFPKSMDLLIIMLGTNDLLQGASPEEASQRMERFLNNLSIEKQKILLIAPPPMKRGEWVTEDTLVDHSIQLAKHYRSLAERLGIHFADAGQWNVAIAYDGVHFTEEGNKVFARNLLEFIKNHLC